MRRILVLRSGGTDLPAEAAAPDVTLLTTHEIVPVPEGIAEALAFDPRGARLVVSSKVTVEILSTEFFEGRFIEVIAVGEETARAVRQAQAASRISMSSVDAPSPPVVVPPLPGASGVLQLVSSRLAGVKGRRPLRGARGAPLTPASREQISHYRRLPQQPPHRRNPITRPQPHAGVAEERILWPRGSDADIRPLEELSSLEALVTAPVVYEKRPRPFLSLSESERAALSEFREGGFGAVAVGSMAALEALISWLGHPAPAALPPVRWGVLGPETARAALSRGLPSPAVPGRARFVDLIELLRKELEKTP